VSVMNRRKFVELSSELNEPTVLCGCRSCVEWRRDNSSGQPGPSL
jgi:hypothetical protein